MSCGSLRWRVLAAAFISGTHSAITCGADGVRLHVGREILGDAVAIEVAAIDAHRAVRSIFE
jgi:hypothetical protein